MNLFECPRIEDAPGYVLGAMRDSEAESYRDHVAQCAECAAKVDELEFVSHALLSAVPQLTAPPEIRHRVMAVVRAEAELLQAAGASADRPPRAEPRRFGLRLGLGRLRPVVAGALATVLLALGLGAGLLMRGGQDSCTTRAATVDRSAGTNPSGTLTVCDGNATLALAGMQAPPPGRIYELWLDDPNDRRGPKPAGLFSVVDGRASVDVGKLQGRTVLVTDEPLPDGSQVPTRTPIVKASV